MCSNERSFLKIKGHRKEKYIRSDECVHARSKLDKYLRSCPREYRALALRKEKYILEVVRTTDGLSTDTHVLLEECRSILESM